MKLLLLLFFFISTSAIAQQADFILLKKKTKTVLTYYSGMNIQLTVESGAYFDALINGIKDDTLYLQQFIIRYLPTNIGTYIIDTVGSYRYKYHYQQIVAIGKAERSNFNLRGSGAALFGGGALIALGSGVVYLADRERFSSTLMLSAIGLGTLGYFMLKGKKNGNAMLIGKKYQLVYMNMSNDKK